MGQLRELVMSFLEEQRLPMDVDGAMIRTLVQVDDQSIACAVVVVEEAGQLIVYSVHPDQVPEDRRPAVVELATRANSLLTVGNFDVELDAGQIRFRTGLSVGESEVPPEMVERVIVDNVATAVAWFPKVAAVIRGELTPSDAMASLSPS